MERERKRERIPKIVWIVLLCNFHNFSGNKQRKTDLKSENGVAKSAQFINSSLVVGDEIADHRKLTHWRWDELRSLSFLRWAQIDFERIFWDELRFWENFLIVEHEQKYLFLLYFNFGLCFKGWKFYDIFYGRLW